MPPQPDQTAPLVRLNIATPYARHTSASASPRSSLPGTVTIIAQGAPAAPVRMLQWLSFSVLALFLMAGITLDRLAGLCFYSLVLLALASIVAGGHAARQSYCRNLQRLWPLHAAMSGFLLCALLNQLCRQQAAIKDYNFALPFLGFVLFPWLFQHFSQRQLRWLGWALCLGSILATAKLYVFTQGGHFRGHPNFMPLLAYSELTAIAGSLALLSVHWDRPPAPALRLFAISLKLTAGCCGLYAIYLFQSRGAWLAIPIFIGACTLAFLPRAHVIKKLLAVTGTLALLALIYGSTDSVQQRLAEAQSDLHNFSAHADLDTSIGTRLQLWKASALIVQEQHGIGVSNDGFSAALHRLAQRGVISPGSASFPHSHNEFLFTGVIFGLPGLITLAAIYAAPLWFFARQYRTSPPAARTAALMGMVLCLAFAANGLVDVMFLWREAAFFYAICLALLVAAVLRLQYPEAGTPHNETIARC